MSENESTIDRINNILLGLAFGLMTAICFVSVVYPAYYIFLGR